MMPNLEVTSRKIGIMIVDDHAVVRAALRLLVDNQPGMMVVGDASNKAEALEVASREQPDIVLLDLCLRDESGLDLIADLLKTAEETRIIILTGVQDGAEHRRAIHLGAMGVVSKETPHTVLLKAIERVHAGELWLGRQTTAKIVSELRRPVEPRKTTAEAEKITRLTDREREIVSLVGEGMKNKQIGDRLCISETTVRHHLTSILSKVEVSDRLELLIFAYKNNLVSVK
jgi:two-component system nitrate/nitrite response regulator NarL